MPTSTPAPSATPVPTGTPIPTPTQTHTPQPTATPTRTPATINSNIVEFAMLAHTVRVGDTIVWTNRGPNEFHTTTSGREGVVDNFGGAGWNSGVLDVGQSFSHTFTSVGTFPYTCLVHPFSMDSTITVNP